MAACVLCLVAPVLRKSDESAEECEAPKDGSEVWTRTKHTLTNFEVAGVNLAMYEMEGYQNMIEPSVDIEPFELYQDFDIGSRIKGNETWWNMTRLLVQENN